MKHILYITTRIDGIGGLQRIQAIKWNYLIDNFDYKITVLVTNSENEKIYYPLHENIEIHYFHKPKYFIIFLLNYINFIKKSIKFSKPDVILTTDAGLKGILIPLILRTSKNVIFESHGAIYTQELEIKYAIKKYLLEKIITIYKKIMIKNFDYLIVITKWNRQQFNHKNTLVIQNPLPFYSLKRAELINKKIILLSRNSYDKGHDLALQSWKLVVEKHPDWKLEIYSNPLHRIDLKKVIGALGIENSVEFKQVNQDIENVILNSSIHLLPSRTEGFGLVIIETMIYGVPTIAFDCPVGPGEIITNNLDGILVKPYDTEQFAEKICYVIEHPEVRNQLGKNAQETVKKYDIAAIMKQWDLFFRQL